MNRAALLAGAVVFGATVAIFLRPQADVRSAPATSTVAPPAALGGPPAGPAPALDIQAPREAPPRVALHGVVLRGPDGAASRALLSVEGQPEQAYAIGEAVARGWSVHAVQPHRVVLSKGAQRASFELVAPTASAAAVANAVPQPAAKAAPRALPGFVAGPRPPVPDGPAQERNRRFLDAVQGRLQAPPSGEPLRP